MMIGFSSGIIIGAGFIALLIVLGIIPRLIQVSRSIQLTNMFSLAVIFGVLFGAYLSFTNVSWSYSKWVLIIWGGIHGIFNGMLAAALAEILNVFPLLAKRVGLEKYMILLLMAIVFGKIFGSLFQWLFLVR